MNLRIGAKTDGGIYAGFTIDKQYQIFVSPRTLKKCRTQLNADLACKDYLLNGFDDWVLPSVTELQAIARNASNGILSVMPMFKFKDIWTRDTLEHDKKLAVSALMNLQGFNLKYVSKNTLLYVRPIRVVEVSLTKNITKIDNKDLTIERLEERIKILENKINNIYNSKSIQFKLPFGE